MRTYKIVILSILLGLMSCQTKKHQDNKENTKREKHNKTHGNEANEQMHQTSVSELINRFESPERDVYQQPEKVLAYIGDISNKTILDIGPPTNHKISKEKVLEELKQAGFKTFNVNTDLLEMQFIIRAKK